MVASGREKIFGWIAQLTTTRPGAVMAVTAVLMVCSIVLLPQLSVSTSRHGLVEAENPYQKRLNRFFDRFGDPNSPIFFVISGSTEAERRSIVDQLVTRFESYPGLEGRVIARMGPNQLARTLLFQDPSSADALRKLAPSDVDMTEFLEGGVPRYLGALEARLANLGAALQMRMMMPFGANVRSEQVNRVLDRVGDLALTTEAYLAGENPWGHLDLSAQESRRSDMQIIDSAGYVVGEGNAYLLVTVFPDFQGDEVSELAPMVNYLRGVRDDIMAKLGKTTVKVRVTGVPAMAVDELRIVEKGLVQSGVATGLGVLVLFLFSFRSIRQSILAAIPLVVGLVLTLGFVQLVYGRLNLITSSFIPVLLGLGIDFPVHLLSRFNEFRRGAMGVVDSIRQTLLRTGPGILTGALTTVLAFLTTATTEFTAFAELGVITAVGLVLMSLATFFTVPAMTFKLQRTRDLVPPELPGTTIISIAVRGAPRLVILLGAVAAFMGAMALDGIRFNYRYFDFLPQETESAQGLAMLENDLAMGPTFANVTAESVEEARALAERLRELPSVATVQTATDLLPPLGEAGFESLRRFFDSFSREPNFTQITEISLSPEVLDRRLVGMLGRIKTIENIFRLTGQSTQSAERGLEALTKLRGRIEASGELATPLLNQAALNIAHVIERAWTTGRDVAVRGGYAVGDVPEVLHNRFLSKDKEMLALYVYPKGDIWDRSFARRFAADLESVDPEASGFAITLHAHSSMILGGFKRAALIAGILICLLLLGDFRNIERAFLALVPTLFGWCWMLGIMEHFDIDFNVANIVILPLVLGIGIDAGVHMVHRAAESAGGTKRATIEELLRGTGSAVMLASITTMVGFAGLLLADYGGMKSLGLVMVLGIACCLTACLVILPAILLLGKRAR